MSTQTTEIWRATTTKAATVEFRNYGEITIPEGLRCSSRMKGKLNVDETYFLDEFPEDMFPRNSIIRHDAVHYGVILTSEQVN